MSYSDDRLRGVGGWLAFLVISLMALGPVVGIASTFGDLSQVEQANPLLAASAGWGIVKTVLWILTLIQVAMMVFTGWRLNRDYRRSTVKFAIVMLWVMGPVWSVVTLAAIALLMNSNPIATASSPLTLARPVIWALAWTLYLVMSRRVANTYDEEGPEADGDLANVFE
ncbi:MAG TPA: DUF2569 family protein [Allosphingosinicella sp.]|nr:DUF2569 family protein [Allosphingosinicella sp.]